MLTGITHPAVLDDDPHRHLVDNPQWVLRRVLEYGDLQQNRLARRYLGDEAVAEAARHRSLNPRVRRSWEVVLQQWKVGA